MGVGWVGGMVLGEWVDASIDGRLYGWCLVCGVVEKGRFSGGFGG